uniref:G_PROTEIN_RECEP_F1_2 domain-containing protein n=1 Tax=Rhabditophanes sp. KR3021 TaxID=114890 RepID=A0AC35THC0_9BILA
MLGIPDVIPFYVRVLFALIFFILLLTSYFLGFFMIKTFIKNQKSYKNVHVFYFLYNLIVADIFKNIPQLFVYLPMLAIDGLDMMDSKLIQYVKLCAFLVFGSCFVFEILCEFQTLAYTAWVTLTICLSFNRFLTFFNPTIVRRNSKLQIIILCMLCWAIAIVFVVSKIFMNITKTYDYENFTVKDDMSKSTDCAIVLYAIAIWAYNVSPTVLFLLYVLSFIRVRRFSKLRSNSAVSASKFEVKNSINFDKVILIQGFFICITWQLNILVEYFTSEVLYFMNDEKSFYFTWLESCLRVILSMINPITFFICNRTAKDYFISSFKFW